MGEVDWNEGVSYVACVYGAAGDEPGDCTARWGRDALGLWWADDGDDTVRCDQWGPFATEAEARAKAEEVAEANDEGEEGETAEAMVARLDAEAEDRAAAGGEWVVLVDGDVESSYAARADAERVIEGWWRGFRAHNGSGSYPSGGGATLGHREDDGSITGVVDEEV